MKNKSVIIWMVLILVSLGLSQAKAQSIYGDFPYYQSFRTSGQPGEIEKATPQGGKANAATFTTDGLRLTPATAQQFGAVFIKNKQFQSIQGIRIEFEYVMYSGNGADGMSVFLFDASVAIPTIGAAGCGLGYAYNRANNNYSASRATGLSGAYLGIALDSYGNFKQRRFQGEARVNGIPDLTTSTSDLYTSNVTLRGARGGSVQASQFSSTGGMGAGYTGYPILISQPTKGENSPGWKLNDTGGAYSSINTYKGNFDLRGGQNSYRKAIIELFPDAGANGFLVTVSIQHEQDTTIIIDGYHYKESLQYAENAYTSAGDYNTTNPNPTSVTSTLAASIPDFFRIGFAASTGESTDIHLLRELKITLPGSAEANDDHASTYKGVSVTIDPLSNDIGYTGHIVQKMTGDTNNLDPSSFRFCDESGAEIGVPYADGVSYSAAIGIWQFDFATKKLTFTPAGSFIGEASVKYNIKAGLNNEVPYNDDAYRSLPTTVRVDVVPGKAVISNRMVTGKIEIN
ncbi:hypothetical protein GGR21_000634 [Dysgonomonas hofstadii]|uniref:Uncharacterized protein n=1 Tax=Dysgonomonas hofstadii TaxID=637886 RepID=A0A840CFH1_9BACT|nr:hypothetical protein [Dysgonomonas hofstadii]MBB4034747.1 hypothetical protein [Dysgonomonas hofstadii]